MTMSYLIEMFMRVKSDLVLLNFFMAVFLMIHSLESEKLTAASVLSGLWSYRIMKKEASFFLK